MRHWPMYLAIAIVLAVVLRNAAGSVALLLAGGQAGSGFVKALEGPASSQKGSFKFSGTSIALG